MNSRYYFLVEPDKKKLNNLNNKFFIGLSNLKFTENFTYAHSFSFSIQILISDCLLTSLLLHFFNFQNIVLNRIKNGILNFLFNNQNKEKKKKKKYSVCEDPII